MKLKALSTHGRPVQWRALTLVLLLYPMSSYGQRVTLPRGKNLRIIDLLEVIRQQTHYYAVYNQETLQEIPGIDVDLPPNLNLDTALKKLFAGLWLLSDTKDRVITIYRDPKSDVIFKPLRLFVTNRQQEVLADASIFVLEDGRTFSTDNLGRFSHTFNRFVTNISISYAGYLTKSVKVTNKTDVNHIVLDPSPDELNKVYVIPYGTMTRRRSTGSEFTVQGEEIAKRTNTNPLEGLEGQAASLFIRHYNGVPGSSFEVEIRGQHSMQLGNYPLIVVDGILLADNGGTVSTIGSGSAQQPYGASILNCIPIDLIKSITVLRGANATAIYGSRASNGVLLITMKEGTTGPLRLTVDVNAGISRVVKTSRLLNTSQFLQMRAEAVANDGISTDSSALPEQYYWGSTRNTNFKKTITGRTAQQYHGHLELEWSEKNTNFLLSGSTLEQSSVFPGKTSDDRQSLYGQLQYRSPNDKLRVGFASLYNYEGNRLPVEDYSRYMTLAPDAPVFFTAQGQPQWTYNGLPYANIPALENNVYQSATSTWFVHVQLHYELPLSGLSLESLLGYNLIAANEASRQPVSGEAPQTVPPPTGQLNTARNGYNSELVEQLVKYSHAAGPGQLDALAGVTWQGQNSHVYWVNQQGYASDVLMRTGAIAPQTTIANTSAYYRYDAAFGRVDYNIRDRYIVSGSWRRDGSSRFGPGEQYGDFWSAGAAWILPWLRYLKLSGSYGTTGNDETGQLGYTEVYSPTTAARGYQGLQGVVPDSLYDPYLHWEVSHMIEAALDLGLLNNKILFTATGYYSRSNNQAVTLSLASQAGRPGVLANEPIAVVNEGLEFQLQVHVLKDKLKWTSALNLTLPRNRLASYPGLANSAAGATLVIGRPIDAIRSFHFTGIDPQKGIYTFQGQDSNGLVGPSNLVASPAPDQRCYGGWTNHFQYKHWQVEISMQFVAQDGENPLSILYQQNPPGVEETSQLSNGPIEWQDHWRNASDPAKLQKLSSLPGSRVNTALYAYEQSDASIIDASYLRLSHVSLSYQLPKKALGRLGACRLYIRGEDLWTFSRFPVTDPESQDPRILPIMRTVLAGLQLTL